jgi:hypothetical protein
MHRTGFSSVILLGIVALVIIVGIVGYFFWKDSGLSLAMANQCQLFTSYVAQDFVQPQLCQNIPPDVIGGTAGWAPPGYQIDYERSDCFYATAAYTDNKSLCAEVIPANTVALNGSDIDQAHCIASVDATNGKQVTMGTSGPGVGEQDLEVMMQKLGYTNQDLLQAQPASSSDWNWQDYLELIWSNPGFVSQRAEFLSRVQTLRCQ